MIKRYNSHAFQKHMFDIAVYTTWILYILIALGISTKAPKYLDSLQYFIKAYVSIFLIYRFNPFRKIKFTDFDAKISFSAGVFLIATTAIDKVLKKYIINTKNYATENISKIKNKHNLNNI